MERFKQTVDTIRRTQDLTYDQLVYIMDHIDDEKAEYLYAQAREVSEPIFHKAVYLRGLIEFTNICKNDCTVEFTLDRFHLIVSIR